MRQTLNASTPTRLATTAAIDLPKAAAATFLVDKTEANPNPATPEVTSHPCEGLQSSLIHLTRQALTQGGETTRIFRSASGGCRLNVTVNSEIIPLASLTQGASCSISVTPQADRDGSKATVLKSGQCRGVTVTTTFALTHQGMLAATLFSGGNGLMLANGTATARARTSLYGVPPFNHWQKN